MIDAIIELFSPQGPSLGGFSFATVMNVALLATVAVAWMTGRALSSKVYTLVYSVFVYQVLVHLGARPEQVLLLWGVIDIMVGSVFSLSSRRQNGESTLAIALGVLGAAKIYFALSNLR